MEPTLSAFPGDIIRSIAYGDPLTGVVLMNVCRGFHDYLADVVPRQSHKKCEVCRMFIPCDAYNNDPKSCGLCDSRVLCQLRGVCELAAARNQFEVLKWLLSRGYRIKNRAEICCAAATNGNLPMLQWAKKRGYPMITRISECAAAAGHLHVVRWLRENGGCWNIRVHHVAMLGGHIDILQYMHDDGRRFRGYNNYIHDHSAEIPLKTLQWLHANGYNIREKYTIHAMTSGRVDILEWIHATFSVKIILTEKLLIQLVITNQLAVIKWLHAMCPIEYFNRAGGIAAACGNIAVFEYLISNGCDCLPYVITVRVMTLIEYFHDYGVRDKFVPDYMISYLRSVGYDWPSGLIKKCTDASYYELADWLRELGCPE